MYNDINIIIKNKFFKQDDQQIYFGLEPVMFIEEDKDMCDILVMCGIFKSKSEARKNWKRTGKDILWGYREYEHVGKKHLYITILKPVPIGKTWKEMDDNI